MAYRSVKERFERHECELFMGGIPEASESERNWRNCVKNPDHINFICAQDFKDNHLLKVMSVRSREQLRAMIDLTVMLKVHYTSSERPDDDEFSQCRGTCLLRTGTGMVDQVSSPKYYNRCPCGGCEGKKMKKHWRFLVRTARHVVFDTAEAKRTKIDLFLDDEGCERDGRMKSVWGMEVWRYEKDRDRCDILCVTCDEDLGERIESAWQYFNKNMIRSLDLSGLDLFSTNDRECFQALIVSHPHGQPKKITWGELREKDENYRVSYTVPTCPGSSGAPLFHFRFFASELIFPPVHCGNYSTTPTDQLNFGY